MTCPASEDARLRRSATRASLAVALTLILAKLFAYLVSGSVSLLSSLVDSASDLMASTIAAMGVRVALRPADQHHRFGHGKAEPIAALMQAAFITGSAVFLSIEAVSRLLDPQPITGGSIAIGVMLFASALTLGLVSYQRSVVRRTGSIVVGADQLHFVGDLLINGAVILALVLTEVTGWTRFDAVFAFVIAAVLIRGAVRITRDSLDVLMDHELPDAERARIDAIVRSHPQTRGLHDLRTRRSGSGRFIELHLELDRTLSLAAAHDITDEIEDRLRAAFPDAQILIHQEPEGVDDDRLDHRIDGAAGH